MIVAQYLDSTNNSAYSGAEGVILVRKYPVSNSMLWGGNRKYTSSQVYSWLNNTYYNSCGDQIKSLMSDITFPYYLDGASMTTVTQKAFLMSAYELCNQGNCGEAGYEGIMWDYWKQKTGLTEPDAMGVRNADRVMRTSSGSRVSCFTRSYYTVDRVCCVSDSGSIIGCQWGGTLCAVLPACFVSKN